MRTRLDSRSPLSIALLYALFGVGWIVGTDLLAGLLPPSESGLAQTFKGLLYILVTSGLVYWLSRRALSALAEKDRRSQAELQASEDRFRRAIERAPLPVFMFTDTKEVLSVSRAWAEGTGYSQQELPDFDAWKTLADDEDDRQAADENMAALFGSATARLETERWVRCKDGSRRLWHFTSASLGALGDGRRVALTMADDVTERRAAEEALRRQERFQRAILAASPLAIVVLDVEGTVWGWSAAAETVFGWTEAEALGAPPRFVDEDDEAFRAQMQRGLAGGDRVPERTQLRRKDGSRVTVELVSAPLRDDEARTFGVLLMYEEISERERLVAERERLAAQLRHAAKLEAVGLLAGGIAHDFNNLLQVINGFSEMVAETLGPEHEVADEIAQVRSAGVRAAVLVSRLLTFSRRRVLQRSKLDLEQVVVDLMKMLRRVIGEGIELTFEPSAGRTTLIADRGLLEQVVMNLCINARDAMPNGGHLRLRLRDGALPAEEGEAATPCLVLEVEDDGVGMDDETQARIFEPFFTTKREGRGTGLGLATVFGIVSQHEGHVEVTSKVGEGTRFSVSLPYGNPADATPDLTADLPVRARGQELVLVAEDDEQVRTLTRSLLEAHGYTVCMAENGEAALATFEAHDARVDLLLSDVVMPKLSGPDLLAAMRIRRPDLPAIFATGYSEEELDGRLRMQAGVTVLNKPFENQTLLSAVRRAIDEARPG